MTFRAFDENGEKNGKYLCEKDKDAPAVSRRGISVRLDGPLTVDDGP